MKKIIAFVCGLLLLCAIVWYCNSGKHVASDQLLNNSNVVIQQVVEMQAPETTFKNSNDNNLSRSSTPIQILEEAQSPRSISAIEYNQSFNAPSQKTQKTNTNLEVSPTKNSLSFEDNSDEEDFEDTQEGPDQAFENASDTRLQQAIAQYKPLGSTTGIDLRPKNSLTNTVSSDYYNNLKNIKTTQQNLLQLTQKDQYTGANPQLDQQLLQNKQNITTTQQQINNLKYQVSTIESNAVFAYSIKSNNKYQQKMADTQTSITNLQTKLDSLNKQQQQIMTARQQAYKQQLASSAKTLTIPDNSPTAASTNQSKLNYTSLPIKTKIAGQYNKIGDMMQSSPWMSKSAISFPAAKPVETSSPELVELD